MHARGLQALERGVTIQAIANLPVLLRIARARSEIDDAMLSELDRLEAAVETECAELENVTLS
jgi:hypothetical protein